VSRITLARFGPPTNPELAVQSAYDPGIIALIKDVPGRRWLATSKVWVIPDNPDTVLQFKLRLEAAGHSMYLTPDVKEALNKAYAAKRVAHAIREAGDAEVEWPLRTQPYAHQRAGLKFLQALGGGALLWEMGLGKTLGAIAFCEALAAKNHQGTAVAGGGWEPASEDIRVLVIVPNTVKRNWGREIEQHAGHSDYVIPDGDYKKRMPLIGSRRYTILNTEALSHAAMAKHLQGILWDVVIVDESTRFKGHKSLRTKNLLKLRAKHRVILTGTPITNNAEDAWAPFEFVSPGLFGKSFFAFRDRYLELDYWKAVRGIKAGRADELRERIDSHSYRALKADLLDLPPKVYSDRVVEMTGEQAKAYAAMRDELRVAYEAGEVEAFNVLTQMLRLTQITAGFVGEAGKWQRFANHAKQAEMDALMDELGDEPVVVFGLYHEELEALADRYAPAKTYVSTTRHGIQPPIIYGPTPETVRAHFIDEFQAGKIKRLFVQSRTGGIGINLTAARTAIYHTRGWSLEEYLQSQDRLHRIGQTGTVSIIHLIAEGSVDEQIAKALRDKRTLADNLTGDAARQLAREVLGMTEGSNA
jgi:SNF2 family DNA or RNA helicase